MKPPVKYDIYAYGIIAKILEFKVCPLNIQKISD